MRALPLETNAAPAQGVAASERRDDRGDIKLTGISKAFSRCSEVFEEGAAPDLVYQVVSGTVCTSRMLSDGRRQITDFYLPGDVFGLEFGSERRCGAEALSEVVVVIARRSAMMADGEVGARLWRHAVGELQRSQEHVVTLGRRAATERVASFLMELSRRLGDADAFELPMTRQDIADYLGLTIETVSRTFSQLQALRYVRLKSCRQIEIARRADLEDLCQ